MLPQHPEPDPVVWLRPAQAAPILKVTTRTLRKWANARKVTVQRTLGGHRWYREDELRALAAERLTEAEVAA